MDGGIRVPRTTHVCVSLSLSGFHGWIDGMGWDGMGWDGMVYPYGPVTAALGYYNLLQSTS